MNDQQASASFGYCPDCNKPMRVRNAKLYCLKCDKEFEDTQPQPTKSDEQQICDYPICSQRGSWHPWACNCKSKNEPKNNPQPRARAQDWEQIITGILRGSSLDRNKEYTERFWNNCGLSIDRLRAASAEQAATIERLEGQLKNVCEILSKAEREFHEAYRNNAV